MIESLLLPLTIDFVQQAIAVAVLLSVAASVLSCFLVLRGWALMGDAISHAVLPGIVIAYAVGVPVVAGAFAAGLFCSVATGFLSENSRLKEDTVMGIVFSGMFGLGIVLFSALKIDVHLHEILFGDILGVSWGDVAQTGLIVALATGVVLLWRKDLVVFAFDPQHAKTIGLSTGWLHYGLLVILSIVIVAGLKAVGIILVIALLIAPGAIAYLLSDRFDTMLLIAVATGVFSAVTGVLGSFYLDSAPAPTIVLVMMIIFILVFCFAPRQGVLSRFLVRRKANLTTTR